MPLFRRAEIWTDLQAAGGARLAAVPDLIAAEEQLKLSGDDDLVLSLPQGSSAWTHVKERRALRIVYTDDTFDEWRILGILEERQSPNAKLGQIKAGPPLVDLARGLVLRTEADGLVHFDFEGLQLTPTEHINSFVLPALTGDGINHFSLGTIDPTWPVDVVYAWDSPLAVLRRLAEVTGCELRIRRNGTTDYKIDLLTQFNAAAALVDVRLGKNLRGVQRDRSSVEQVTRVYPKGAAEDGLASSMNRAVWEVVSVVGSVVRLKDTIGGDGPAQFADQLNGLYLRKTSGTLTQISATAVISATQTDVTVASAASITAGDLVQIRKNSAGDDLTYLEAPAQKTSYGLLVGVLERQDIPDTLNLVKNPSQRAWGGASTDPPDNWTKLGSPTLARTTTAGRWRVGGKSCRVQSTADGQGLETAYVTVTPTAAAPYFSGYVSVWLESGGQVRVELVATDGSVTYVFPDATDGKAWTSQQKIWVDLGVAGIDLMALNITQVKIRIVQDGDTAADFYVDAAQITQTAGQRPWIEGSGGTRLWQAANDYLLRTADPAVKYTIDIIDVNRLNPGAWPFDALVLGGPINVKDTGLGITASTRVIELTRNLLVRGDSKVVLSSRPEDLTDVLVRPRAAPRISRDPDSMRDPTVEAFFARDPLTQTTVTVRIQGRPASAKFYYYLDLASVAPPPIGASTWTLYAGPFNAVHDSSNDKILSVYAQLGNRFTPVRQWRLDGRPVPSVATSQVIESGASPNVTVRRELTFTPAVTRFAIYRKTGGWPTIGGSQSGPLDPAQLKAERSVLANGGGRNNTGGAIVGGPFYEDSGYSTTQVVYDIVVPIDDNGVPGTRYENSYTVQNSAAPALTAFSFTLNQAGSSCSAGSTREEDFSWTPNANVANATHYVQVWYRQYPSGGWELLFTEGSPATTTTRTDVSVPYYNSGKPNSPFDLQFKIELHKDSDNSLLQTLIADGFDGFDGRSCAV